MHDRCHPPVSTGREPGWFAKSSRHSPYCGVREPLIPNLGTLSQLSKQCGNKSTEITSGPWKTSTLPRFVQYYVMLWQIHGWSITRVQGWAHCLDRCFPTSAPGHVRSPRGLRRQLTMFHIQVAFEDVHSLHAWHMLRSMKYNGHYATHWRFMRSAVKPYFSL